MSVTEAHAVGAAVTVGNSSDLAKPATADRPPISGLGGNDALVRNLDLLLERAELKVSIRSPTTVRPRRCRAAGRCPRQPGRVALASSLNFSGTGPPAGP